MPTLNCNRNYLFQLIGKQFSNADFEKICFRFGLELEFPDENEANKDNSSQYKLDCPANRHDLLCVEGLSLALSAFLDIRRPPNFVLQRPLTSVKVFPSVHEIRPYIACAVLRDISFTEDSFTSFIDYQEKLHQGLCRKRMLASVGTHDLDKICLPIEYSAYKKEDIKFVPLKQVIELNCAKNGLEEFYKDDKHISKYIPLINGYERYPVVSDSAGKVLSLPPIINSSHSEITQKTRNVFIECTGKDKNKTNTLLNLIVSAFSVHCKEKFSIESVEVRTPTETITTPLLDENIVECDSQIFAQQIGIPANESSPGEMEELLQRMQLHLQNDTRANGLGKWSVKIPMNRPDVLHQCDIMEDVAIAYGYDKLVSIEKPVPTAGHGLQTKIGKVAKLLRNELAFAGYNEILPFSLCAHEEAFQNCLRTDYGNTVVRIENPKTREFQICRPTLLPGILKTVASNLKEPLPIRLFEVSDVVLKDTMSSTGAANHHHVAALHAHAESSSFENIRGLLDFLFEKLEVNDWFLRSNKTETTTYMEGRGAEICIRDGSEIVSLGNMGVIHPQVLENFGIPFPCAYFEISLSFFLR
ncbi:phenylalanyl-tRNA synthetase beta subunit [Perkinsela sp. CCAP 1560/4]|nr:phenylalanyl-tRNA synthetase beta subunit [Perkinsela sp. CCAP 1560/4]|eukprot:KNH05302.1 phenylalanyl-tRNA synthetase beta subunit [Perkinsela sp. CCAP 1560/4]